MYLWSTSSDSDPNIDQMIRPSADTSFPLQKKTSLYPRFLTFVTKRLLNMHNSLIHCKKYFYILVIFFYKTSKRNLTELCPVGDMPLSVIKKLL